MGYDQVSIPEEKNIFKRECIFVFQKHKNTDFCFFWFNGANLSNGFFFYLFIVFTYILQGRQRNKLRSESQRVKTESHHDTNPSVTLPYLTHT